MNPAPIAEAYTVPRVTLSLKEQVFALAEEYGVSTSTVDALIACESGWDPDKVGPTGDIGLWQISPYYWPQVNATNPLEASKWALGRIKNGNISDWVCSNCYLYIKAYFYPNLPKMADIVPNTTPHIGAVVILDYNGVKHIAYISGFSEDGNLIVKEANYLKPNISSRILKLNDSHIQGFWAPDMASQR